MLPVAAAAWRAADTRRRVPRARRRAPRPNSAACCSAACPSWSASTRSGPRSTAWRGRCRAPRADGYAAVPWSSRPFTKLLVWLAASGDRAAAIAIDVLDGGLSPPPWGSAKGRQSTATGCGSAGSANCTSGAPGSLRVPVPDAGTDPREGEEPPAATVERVVAAGDRPQEQVGHALVRRTEVRSAPTHTMLS